MIGKIQGKYTHGCEFTIQCSDTVLKVKVKGRIPNQQLVNSFHGFDVQVYFSGDKDPVLRTKALGNLVQASLHKNILDAIRDAKRFKETKDGFNRENVTIMNAALILERKVKNWE